jgi:hypothetical protein
MQSCGSGLIESSISSESGSGSRLSWRKKNTAKICLSLFDTKLQLSYVQTTGEAFRLKEIIQHFKTGYRTPLNPDPVRNRLHSTGLIKRFEGNTISLS